MHWINAPQEIHVDDLGKGVEIVEPSEDSLRYVRGENHERLERKVLKALEAFDAVCMDGDSFDWLSNEMRILREHVGETHPKEKDDEH